MLEQAIKTGFTCYSITEHAPLPADLFPTEELRREFAMLPNELPQYFKLVNELKKEYGHAIQIRCGMEFDYLEGYESFIKKSIQQYSSELDEVLLSIHFLEGKTGFRGVDYNPDDFSEGLIAHYGTSDQVHRAYWEAIEKMISEPWPSLLPIRVGHLAIINKFIQVHPLSDPARYDISFFEPLFQTIKKKGYSLDVNMAGLMVQTCQSPYFTKPMWYWSKQLAIDLVYGSDAHSIHRVGCHYDKFVDACSKNAGSK